MNTPAQISRNTPKAVATDPAIDLRFSDFSVLAAYRYQSSHRIGVEYPSGKASEKFCEALRNTVPLIAEELRREGFPAWRCDRLLTAVPDQNEGFSDFALRNESKVTGEIGVRWHRTGQALSTLASLPIIRRLVKAQGYKTELYMGQDPTRIEVASLAAPGQPLKAVVASYEVRPMDIDVGVICYGRKLRFFVAANTTQPGWESSLQSISKIVSSEFSNQGGFVVNSCWNKP